MSKNLARAAGVSYILWGIIHVLGGAAMLSTGSALGIATMLSGTDQTGVIPHIINGIAQYHSFNIVLYGLGVLVAGILIIKRNSKAVHVVAFALAGLADLGLILFMVMPGYMTVTDASPGLLLFAGWCSTILSFIH